MSQKGYNPPMPRVPKHTLKPLNLGSESIGQRIANLRKSLGLTQQDLAERIGIERNAIAKYETDRMRLYDEMVSRVAIALRTTPDVILGFNKSDTASNPS